VTLLYRGFNKTRENGSERERERVKRRESGECDKENPSWKWEEEGREGDVTTQRDMTRAVGGRCAVDVVKWKARDKGGADFTYLKERRRRRRKNEHVFSLIRESTIVLHRHADAYYFD